MAEEPHRSLARRASESVAYRWRQHRAGRLCRALVISHTLPERAIAGEICGTRVELENAGSSSWRADGERAIQLHVSVDDALVAAIPLPVPEVGAGARVTFHFALPIPPHPGVFRLRASLAIPSVPFAAHLPGLHIALIAEPDSNEINARAFETMIRHNLWHYLPTSGIARSRRGHPYPQFITKAEGACVWDANGNRFIDYSMAWGATILGHADPRIQQAIRDALGTAPLAPFPHPVEMDVTRMLLEDFGGEFVLFGKNGSDVCTVAARLARLATGRRTILSCGFHGWQDFSLDHLDFASTGVPNTGTFHKFAFNCHDSFLTLFERHRHDLAAVMLEPAGPHGDQGLEAEPDPEFLRLIASAARDAGALVIYDEIVTGYRYRSGSVQKAFGQEPDLTCLGKALASGMPLAALVGRTRRFHELMARTRYNPTFKAEVYSLAAAKTAIEIYRREPIAACIAGTGTALKAAIDAACVEHGVAAACRGPAFRFHLVFDEPDPYRERLKRTLLFQGLLEERVITVSGVMLPSTAHSPQIVSETLSAFHRVLATIASAERAGSLERSIEIPLL